MDQQPLCDSDTITTENVTEPEKTCRNKKKLFTK